ncbi:hypothetical protein LCGC14_3040350, partial [marine sediment metagenome]
MTALRGAIEELKNRAARIAELEEALRKVQPLLRDTVDSHA